MGIDTCGSCVVNSTTTGVSSGWSSGISSVASEASGDASVEMDDPDSPSGQLHSTEEEETRVSTSQAERRGQQACVLSISHKASRSTKASSRDIVSG